ncbi:hypothetical protein F3Y22_tig00110546pilonHSYRG00079 [Hibiscus syriacus]|uniref:Pyrrolo-quinoline quinone repeat domain-containing protein n=1 Tax=Hibiscus syriacus TaxID=106335 RepID=A0A6A3AFC9_HIBSY|nr:hypothetical protein F3Y22_tig00110546pilonHSYRG00079 [Hibiscus syriacus]
MDYADADWTNHGGDLNNRRYAVEKCFQLVNSQELSIKMVILCWQGHNSNSAVANGVVYFHHGMDICMRDIRTAVVIALARATGRLVWSTTLDPRPRVLITGSGTVYMGAFYVGVSSLEEGLPPEQCCTFRGSVVKLAIRTGAILWQTYMLPDNGGRLGGYAGAAVWGSSPAIDTSRRLVYVATGNSTQLLLKCRLWRSPMLLTITSNGTFRDVAVALQKSGFAWALDRDNGAGWTGGKEGGGIWGAATDGRRIYTNIANSDRQSFMRTPSNQTTTAGAWVALDANTGDVLWARQTQQRHCPGACYTGQRHLFVGSVASDGPIYAIDTNTGNLGGKVSPYLDSRNFTLCILCSLSLAKPATMKEAITSTGTKKGELLLADVTLS